MADPKTGEFSVQVWLGLEASEDEKGTASVKLLNEMMHRVAVILQDGRAYELTASFPAWEPDLGGGWPLGYKWWRVEFTVHLADALDAEVGEWVVALPIQVPDDLLQVVLPGGYVFERDEPGWRRVE